MHGNHDEVFSYTLHKDPDQRYSEKRKVEKLLQEAIQVTNPELMAAKVLTESLHGNNFTDACGYFSQQVSRVHHAPAQLEY
jgi:ABC-type transporter MlaC component